MLTTVPGALLTGHTVTGTGEDLRALEGESVAHDREEVLRNRNRMVGAQARPQAAVERLLNARRAMTHGHIDLRTLRDVAAAVLDQLPGVVRQIQTMDVFIAGPQQPGAPQLQQGGAGVDR